MANSDMLVRIKANTDNYNAGIAKASRTLNQFKQDNLTIGGAVNQLTKSLTAAAAGYMSLAAAGSAITGIVKESVELAKAGEGIRLAFNRLNRPDLLDGLRQATHGTITDIELMKAAVRFDDFKLNLDDMGAMLAFAQQKAKDTGQSVDYMVESITMGLGRQSKQILDNLGISASEITKRMKDTGDMTKAVAEIIREQMAKSGDYIETAAERATKADVDLKNAMEQLGKVFAPLTESANSFFSAVQIGAIKALTYIGKLMNTLSGSGRAANVASGEEAGIQKGLGKLRVAKAAGSSYMVNSLYNDQVESYNRRINDYDAQIKNGGKKPGAGSGESRDIRWLQAQRDGLVIARDQYIQQAKQIMTPIVNNTTIDTGGKTKKSGAKKSLPEYADFNKQLLKSMIGGGDDLKQEIPHFNVFETFKDRAKFDPENILGSKDAWEKYKDTITGSIGSIGESMSNLTQWTPDFDPFLKKQKEMTKAAKQQQMAFNMGAEAANNLGAAFSQMEDPAAKAAGTVISAIANIALGFAQASVTASSMGPWGWVAFLAAGAAAMATTISTVHSLTGYAEGGIIKGNSYSGDNIGGMVDGGAGGFVGLNAGEVVLNAAQQRGVANALNEGGNRRIEVFGRLAGETIFLSSDRYTRRTGRGTILTWK